MRMIIFALIMIVCDIATGIFKAVYNGNINSTYLRKGLLHKLSEIASIVVSYIIEYGIEYTGLDINLHIAQAVCIYILIMEIVSTLENISEVNPQLNKLFKPYLDKLKGGSDNETRD